MTATPAWPPKSLPRLFVRSPLSDGAAVEMDAGLTPMRDAELRFGFHAEHYAGRVKIGAPGIPSLNGPEYEFRYRGVYDGQNSAVLPSDGLRVATTARHVIEAPEHAGNGLLDGYSRRWRPFLEVGPLYDSHAKWGERVTAGVVGSVFGGDQLGLYITHASASSNHSTPVTEVGIRYRWMY